MFNTLRNRNNFQQDKSKDRFNFIQPEIKLICDFKLNLDNTNSNFTFNTPLNISEMYLHEDLLILLSEDGLIYLVNILSQKLKILTFYSSTHKIAKSISFNIANESLLIVYLLRESYIAELKCAKISSQSLKQFLQEEISLSQIRPEEIFLTENLSSPAFVEFDELNQKIITRNSLATYKIWNMKDFKLVFEMTDRRIEEIRTADGIFLTIRSEDSNRLLLSIYEIDTGRLVINYEVDLIPLVELEIIEIFDKILLLKQSGKTNMALIINLITFEYNFIRNEHLDEKSLFMYINKSDIFVTLNQNSIFFYSIDGYEIRNITNENIEVISPNLVHLTNDKNYLLVYWEERKEKPKSNFLNIQAESHSNNFNLSNNNIMLSNLKTPKSKKMAGKSSKVLFTENSSYLSFSQENFNLASEVKNVWNNNTGNNFNTTMSKIINSEISEISHAKDEINTYSNYSQSDVIPSEFKSKYNNHNFSLKKKFQIFKGEFELISLKDNISSSKLIINSDNLRIRMQKENPLDNAEKLNCFINNLYESEIVSYFIYNTKTMRIYIMMQSGKLFECCI